MPTSGKTSERILLRGLGLAFAVLLAGSNSSAFQYNGRTWCQDTVSFYAYSLGPTSTCAAGSPQTMADIVAAASQNWGTNCVVLDYLGTSGTVGCIPDMYNNCVGNLDGFNSVSMSPCKMDTTRFATAYSWWRTSGPDECCLLEVDICFNDDKVWWVDAGTIGCTGCADLYSVALHEVGHWMGLGHEDDAVGGVPQVMQSWISRCEFRRALTADDALGLARACEMRDYEPSRRCFPDHYHGPTTGVGDESPQLADYLGVCHPNPFNPSTTVEYSIRRAGHVSLRVYNVAGQLVATLVDEAQNPGLGLRSATWDGRDDQGRPVSSGIYFCSLVADGFSSTTKMVLLK